MKERAKQEGVEFASFFCGKENQEWWAMQGLNLRPLPCEGSALPLS